MAQEARGEDAVQRFPTEFAAKFRADGIVPHDSPLLVQGLEKGSGKRLAIFA